MSVERGIHCAGAEAPPQPPAGSHSAPHPAQEPVALSGLPEVPAEARHRPLAAPVGPQVGTAAPAAEGEYSPAGRGPPRRLPASRCLCSGLFQEPFRDISAEYKVDLDLEGSKCLSIFLNQTDLDSFLLELHEMMILKLKTPQAEEFRPEWRYGRVHAHAGVLPSLPRSSPSSTDTEDPASPQKPAPCCFTPPRPPAGWPSGFALCWVS